MLFIVIELHLEFKNFLLLSCYYYLVIANGQLAYMLPIDQVVL